MASTPLRVFGKTFHVPTHRISKPARYGVPFFRLESHTVPVKWSLYRALLRSAPSDLQKQAIRTRWRRRAFRYMTSARKSLVLLRKEESLLDLYENLQNYKGGRRATEPLSLVADTFAQQFPEIYSIEQKLRDKEEARSRLKTSPGQSKKTSSNREQRPVLTGGLIRPTVINPPLPRLKPQPLHITMPIVRRQKARHRRLVQEQAWKEMILHAQQDVQFEDSFQSNRPKPYTELASMALTDIKASNARDIKRLKMKFPPAMLRARDAFKKKRGQLARRKGQSLQS